MTFTFLVLSVAVLLLPIAFHLHEGVFNDGKLKVALGASLLTTLVLSAVGVVLVRTQVVSYGLDQTIGLLMTSLPFEQYILNFAFSFSSISLYLYLNVKFPNNNLQKYSLAVSNLLLGLCVAFLFFAYSKWYTVLTFAPLFVMLFMIEYMGTLRFMYKAYRTYLLMIIPFCLVYGCLFMEEIVSVSSSTTVGVFIFKMPLENIFVLLLMSLMAIYLFEFFKGKTAVE